ncbi:recombinase zinc beta ribbon domain-containing protein [Anoxybacillus flavithermus]|uniref:recombinase zinc beta ribbon domain-containing protein n=1 Tax=Anoxybacillus flavithermus TaxID=33934 RepID=UPI001F51B15E|nr:recombinase zinc beta ribbon domain-containing protein [Anoxybacillus flavithermus]
MGRKKKKGTNPNPIIADGCHEPIINTALWDVVQERRKSKSFKQRQSHEPFLLSGLLKCPSCGQGMVPSITTYTRKDGTKRRHRYYVCGSFHNKGSVACKANSIKANEAEEIVFQLIEQFLQNNDLFNQKILSINRTAEENQDTLLYELDKLNGMLQELTELQEKYFNAFEKNLFPISMLQERLDIIAKEKAAIEQKIYEMQNGLQQAETKKISPEPVRELLAKFVDVYKVATREQKKHLLHLLIKKITLVPLSDRKRIVDKVELEFDFRDIHKSKSFILIHHLYNNQETEHDLSTDNMNENYLPPYLQKFLPLLMIRFTAINAEGAINLLR